MSRQRNRPISTCEEILADKRSDSPAFLESAEFLKAVEAISGCPITRRTLQFYSSPQVRLMPLPRYLRRHTSHYLHPEHTQRLAVISYLRTKHFVPVRELRKTMARLSPHLYPLILRGAILPADIALLARPEGQRFHPYDLVFRRVLGLLSAVEAQEQSAASTSAERIDTASALERFESWFEEMLLTDSYLKPVRSFAFAN